MAFCGYLKQSTTVTIQLGPAVDDADGKTPETGLTIEDTDIYISKNGGAFANPNDTNDCTHDQSGYYTKQLNGTDTGTLGILTVECHESGALLMRQDYQIVVAHWFDTMCSTDYLQVDMIQVEGGDATDALEAGASASLVAHNLDHLALTATAAADMTTEVADNTILSRILANGDTSAFVPSTDGLQLIRDKQTDIETDTAEIGTAGAGLTDLGGMSTGMKAEVEAECTDAIEADGLDHLLAASVTGTDVTDNSIIAKLVSKDATADWDDFVNTTDALQAIRDKQTDIETDTAEIGTAGAGLTDLGGMSTGMKAEIESEVDDALGGGTGTALTAIPWNSAWDTEVESEVTDSLVAHNLDHLALTATAAADMTTEVADNTILSRILANGDTSAFVPSTDGLQPIRDQGDAAWTTAANDPTAATIADAVWDEAASGHVGAGTFGAQAGTDIDAILADTNELQTDWADGGRLDNLLDGASAPSAATVADAVWDEATSGHTTGGTFGEQAKTDIDAILADTNELQTDDIPGTLSALNDISVTDITQRAIPDSIPADGTIPTIEQALYMIVQFLYERAVSGTTVTVKKVDGSTSLLTLTLSDADDPVSITRAT